MDYKEKYNRLLDAIKELQKANPSDEGIQNWINDNVPKLAESEVEKIRKALIRFHKSSIDIDGIKGEDIIAWLEKQVQKPTDETAPKFHEGEWIIRSAEGFKHNSYLVKEVKDYYVCEDLKGRRVTFTFSDVHKNFKLWNISDAKDGDVLITVDDERPFIFKGCLDHNHPDSPVAYCGIDTEGYFCVGESKFNYWWTDEKVHPATKEQRNLLFQKMKEAGYEWYSENKVLNKIVQKSQRLISAEAKEAFYDKVSWSEEDEKLLKQAIGEVNYALNDKDMFYNGTSPIINWLKSIKQRLGGEE